ncbi:MAG: hypothetical protein ABJQ23_18475 [Shimia thalassica]|uniref:hypothetical protein n=1 Tax=Shimia thalassica TaxID=1715693 RepID=UPI003298DDBF
MAVEVYVVVEARQSNYLVTISFEEECQKTCPRKLFRQEMDRAFFGALDPVERTAESSSCFVFWRSDADFSKPPGSQYEHQIKVWTKST